MKVHVLKKCIGYEDRYMGTLQNGLLLEDQSIYGTFVHVPASP